LVPFPFRHFCRFAHRIDCLFLFSVVALGDANATTPAVIDDHARVANEDNFDASQDLRDYMSMGDEDE